MSIDLARLTNDLQHLRVTVVGDPILDVYLNGSIERLCREAPIPIVQVGATEDVPGGAGNVAVNAAALGTQVSFFGIIGDDHEGARLRRALALHQVAPEHLIVEPQRRTPVKHRLQADSQMLARFDQGTRVEPARYYRAVLIDRLRESLKDSDVVIVSDYGYGTVANDVIDVLATFARHTRTPIIADGHDFRRLADLHPTAIKPSFEEVQRLIGEIAPAGTSRTEWISERADIILKQAGSRIVAVTLDTDGAIILEHGRQPVRTYSRPARSACCTGGGDTFVTTLALSLAVGADTSAAAELGAAAATVVIAKEGTATCSARELRESIAGGGKRVLNTDMHARVSSARAQGRRIVFTNGCFDILHRGHVTLLNHAKSLGDLLIVGVNSDASVRRLKGPTRPINTLEDRLNVLAALSCVDLVAPFDGDSPVELIQSIRPDFYAKGGDYTRDTLPETSLVERLGGSVCILPLAEERSTTALIARIRGAA